MIRPCNPADFEVIWAIINDGAEAYRGIIPSDRWTEPYMSRQKLHDEIAEGVTFWCVEHDGELQGVMGMQDVLDATLIRHAYIRTIKRRSGVGGTLLSHLRTLTKNQVLVGTWADAHWAIRFYEKHGFILVDSEEKSRLLRRYWQVPERQVETSVVLRAASALRKE
jgi:N-acetylglutamate synthase-like GNAT family acetyltransferase